METNFEHYKDQMLKMLLVEDRCKFVKRYILSRDCNAEPTINCIKCRELTKKWLDEPYVKPQIKINWSKVPIDTPVLVRQEEDDIKLKRHFALYDNGTFYCYSDGATSWSSDDGTVYDWKFCELARPEDIKKYKK